MSYQQLTKENRYQISVLLAQGRSATMIAGRLGVHRSTAYRELKRNRDQEAYVSERAHQKAMLRRPQARKHRVPKQVMRHVEMTRSWLWSQAQISGIGKLIGLPVSHEWTYRHIAAGKA